MQAVLVRSRKFTFVRVVCFVTLPLVCSVLMCLTWFVNNGTMTGQQAISDLGSSPGRWQYAHQYGTGGLLTSPRNGDPSKYSEHDINSSDPPIKKIPPEFHFRMRSDSNDTIFDEGFASGISPKCLKRDYGNLADWPTASIIITFCDNEILSDVLHTLHSVIQRTPSSLIKEILLIADNTTKDDFKQTLDNYCKAMFGHKVRIYRTTVTMGLIQARLMAARMATGDVVVMLDAHMEVQDKWLEALLYEIKKDRKIMATITMDWMMPTENGRWVYRYGPGNFVCYFDWNLVFGYSWPNPKWNTIYLNDSTVPLPSPCSVGNWAMDKSFFTEIGELDQGMEKWGGENLDIAIRAWLFGGRSVQIPCSHAAHQERPHQRDYRDAWIVEKFRNYKRLVEVWFDGYKKYFYKAYPELMALDPGDLSSRLELKKKAKHNFAWYHRHVYPQIGLYDVNTLAYGQLKSLGGAQCTYYETMNSPVKMAPCRDPKMVMFWSQSGVLRMGAAVVMPQDLREDAILVCAEAMHFLGDKSVPVWVHWKDGPIKVVGHDLCLENDPDSNSVILKGCDPSKENQRWRWQVYTPLYGLMLKSANGDVNDSRWHRRALNELKNLRNSWPNARQPGNKTDKHSERLLVC